MLTHWKVLSVRPIQAWQAAGDAYTLQGGYLIASPLRTYLPMVIR